MILITGATGRIGKYLVKALIDNKEDVRVLVKDKMIDIENVEVFYGDIRNKEVLEEAVKGVDIIYHLAAIVDYLAPKDLMYEVNVIGTKNLLEVSQGKKFIYLSSTAAMGKKLAEIPATENTPCKPTDYYGKTKLEAEKLVLKNNGIVIRSPDVYGIGFREGYDFVFSALEKGKLPIIGSGKNFIQYIHINDLIQALLLVKENGKPGEIYIVSGKEIKTLKEIFNLICKHLGVEPPKKHISVTAAKMLAYSELLKSKIKKGKPELIPEYINKLIANRTFDIIKARKELGYEPKITYDEGIGEMVEDYKKRLKEQEKEVTIEQGEKKS